MEDFLTNPEGGTGPSGLLEHPKDRALRFADSARQVRLTQRQHEFVGAFSAFLSRSLQLDYRILAFRRDVLGAPDHTLSHEEATSFVQSPAVQRFSLDFFEKSSIPIIGHKIKWLSRKEPLFIQPPEQFFDIQDIPLRPQAFRWITPQRTLEQYDVADGSVLAQLEEVCKYFVKKHPLTEELVAYLILCGGTVAVPSLITNSHRTSHSHAGTYDYDYSTITLTVQSWMTPEQVRQAYAKARKPKAVGNTYRSKSHSDRNIAIFRFVIERAKPCPPKDLVPGTRGAFRFMPWRAMVEEWNKQCSPKQKFEQTGRKAEKKFRKAFVDGYRNVTGHNYYVQKPITTREELLAHAKAVNEAAKNMWA